MAAKRKVSVNSGLAHPEFDKIKKSNRNFTKNFRYGLYYAQYELGDKKLKTETIKCAKKIDKKYAKLDILDNYNFFIIGKAAYLLNNQCDLDETWEKYFNKELNKLYEEAIKLYELKKLLEKPKTSVNKLTIQEKVQLKAGEVCSEFDKVIDEYIASIDSIVPYALSKYDPYSVMVTEQIKANHARYIKQTYLPTIDEHELALSGTDEQLKEGYSIFTKDQMNEMIDFYKRIVQSSDMIIDTQKVERKPRKRKPVSHEKMVEKLNYCKSNADLKLVSVNPTDIVGAQELWVYSTKTRKIGRYIAADETGLSVKGSTIQNFTTTSIEKTLRKPDEKLPEFKKLSKAKLKKYLDTLTTTDTKLTGRINKHHILLKVVR